MVACLLALTGCDAVFGLRQGAIAPAVDANGNVPDAPRCVVGADPLDEDCDGVPNAADPCPADGRPGDDSDPDADGVGSACDPGPEQDVRVFFDGFNADGHQQWVSTPASDWAFEGGKLVSKVNSSVIEVAVTSVTKPFIEVNVEDVQPSSTSGSVLVEGVLFGFSSGCQINFTGIRQLQLGAAKGQINGAGAIRLQVFQEADGTVTCRTHVDDAVEGDLVLHGGSTGPPTMVDHLRITTTNVRVTLSSAMLVGQAP